jgi:hypothetical protein
MITVKSKILGKAVWYLFIRINSEYRLCFVSTLDISSLFSILFILPDVEESDAASYICSMPLMEMDVHNTLTVLPGT